MVVAGTYDTATSNKAELIYASLPAERGKNHAKHGEPLQKQPRSGTQAGRKHTPRHGIAAPRFKQHCDEEDNTK
jgi:hypothetical protein